MTIITLSPKGYSDARKRTGARFSFFGSRSSKSWDDLLSEEFKKCPDISGEYEGEGRKLQVRSITAGLYQLHEGRFDDFGVDDAFEISRILGKLKRGSENLASLIETCKMQSEVGQSMERFNAKLLYDFVREERELQGLVVAIDDDCSLINRIYTWHDHQMYGKLEKKDQMLTCPSERITLAYNPERRRLQEEVVYLRVQNMSSPIDSDDRACLRAIVRLLAEDWTKSSGLQMYDLDARFTRV